MPSLFDVTEYGALGNGTACDANAIEAAIAACTENGGGVVFYPAGIYGISRTIRISGRVPIQHLGQGIGTVIRAIPGENGPNPSGAQSKPFTMFEVVGAGPHVFSDMTLDGNKNVFIPLSPSPPVYQLDSYCVGIDFSSGGNVGHGNAVRNVRFINHHSIGLKGTGETAADSKEVQTDLDLKQPYEIVVEGCSFSSVGGRGVFFYFVTGGGVWDCDFDYSDGLPHPDTQAIGFNGCKDFTIARNRITRCQTGISVGSSYNYSITDNLVRGSERSGIQASAGLGLHPEKSADKPYTGYHMSRRFICTGNRIYDSKSIGITVDPTYDYQVKKKTHNSKEEEKEQSLIKEKKEETVQVRNLVPIDQWGIVSNNLVHGTSNNGISVVGSKHMLVQGNMVINAGVHGINLSSSSHCTVVGNHIINSVRYAVGHNMDRRISKEDAESYGHYYIGDDNVAIGEGEAGKFQVENPWTLEELIDGHPWTLGNETYINRYPRQTIFNTLPGEASPSGEGVVRLPPASSELRGEIYTVSRGPNMLDEQYICKKLPDNSFAWVNI